MATLPPKRKPFRPSESTLDFDDGRTSTLERILVWVVILCTIAGAVSEVYQGLAQAGVL